MADDSELASTFAAVARALQAEEGVEATLQRICVLAVRTIDGCDHAGVSLMHQCRIDTPAAGDDVHRQVDKIQCEADEGPCLDAIRYHDTAVVDDLSHDERWPRFGAWAVEETGVRSMLSFRLFVQEDTMGALNLYSKQTGAFDDHAVEVGSVFAAHAAVALSHARTEEQLREGMRSRDVIGQAKGILMARQGVSEEEAFDMLRRASQRLNVKLSEVAEELAQRLKHETTS